MNILILSGSPRKNGNTDLLVEAFAKGASEKHHRNCFGTRLHGASLYGVQRVLLERG